MVGTADSFPRSAARTMGTGRSSRSSSSPPVTRSRAERRPGGSGYRHQRINEAPREVGAETLLLVLEVDKGIADRRQPAHGRSPARDVGRLVAFVAQAEVGVVGRHFDRGTHFLAVGYAERDVPGAKDVVRLLVEPRLVAEFNRCARALWEEFRKRPQHGDVFPEC